MTELENEGLITKPEDRKDWVQEMTDEDHLAVNQLLKAHMHI